MTRCGSDPVRDTLLGLNCDILFLDGAGYWVNSVMVRTQATPELPHSRSYSLMVRPPDGSNPTDSGNRVFLADGGAMGVEECTELLPPSQAIAR